MKTRDRSVQSGDGFSEEENIERLSDMCLEITKELWFHINHRAATVTRPAEKSLASAFETLKRLTGRDLITASQLDLPTEMECDG